jgi:hypothetical protein
MTRPGFTHVLSYNPEADQRGHDSGHKRTGELPRSGRWTCLSGVER